MIARRKAGGSKFIETLENRIFLSGAALEQTGPINLQADTLSKNVVRLLWTDTLVNETGVVIERSLDPSAIIPIWVKVAGLPANTSTWLDTNLQPGTQYSYRVSGLVDNNIFGPLDNVADAVTLTTAEDAFARVQPDNIDNNNGLLKVTGTNGNDIILVEARGGRIYVHFNSDVLDFSLIGISSIFVSGLGGNDRITTGARVGAVTILGGDGNDIIVGGAGIDRIDGGKGNDAIAGGEGNDTITGGQGNDVIYGQGGDDYIDGGAGVDKVLGGDGDDQLFGGAGNDHLIGGRGNDILDGGAGVNVLDP